MNKEQNEEVEKRNSIISKQENIDIILDRQKNMSSDDKNKIRDIISDLSNKLMHQNK